MLEASDVDLFAASEIMSDTVSVGLEQTVSNLKGTLRKFWRHGRMESVWTSDEGEMMVSQGARCPDCRAPVFNLEQPEQSAS